MHEKFWCQTGCMLLTSLLPFLKIIFNAPGQVVEYGNMRRRSPFTSDPPASTEKPDVSPSQGAEVASSSQRRGEGNADVSPAAASSEGGMGRKETSVGDSSYKGRIDLSATSKPDKVTAPEVLLPALDDGAKTIGSDLAPSNNASAASTPPLASLASSALDPTIAVPQADVSSHTTSLGSAASDLVPVPVPVPEITHISPMAPEPEIDLFQDVSDEEVAWGMHAANDDSSGEGSWGVADEEADSMGFPPAAAGSPAIGRNASTSARAPIAPSPEGRAIKRNPSPGHQTDASSGSPRLASDSRAKPAADEGGTTSTSVGDPRKQAPAHGGSAKQGDRKDAAGEGVPTSGPNPVSTHDAGDEGYESDGSWGIGSDKDNDLVSQGRRIGLISQDLHLITANS